MFFVAIPHRFNSVHAGQDQPVVASEILQGGIEGLERARLVDFDKRNFKHIRAEGAQLRGEASGLMPSATYEDADSAERLGRGGVGGLAHGGRSEEHTSELQSQ